MIYAALTLIALATGIFTVIFDLTSETEDIGDLVGVVGAAGIVAGLIFALTGFRKRSLGEKHRSILAQQVLAAIVAVNSDGESISVSAAERERLLGSPARSLLATQWNSAVQTSELTESVAVSFAPFSDADLDQLARWLREDDGPLDGLVLTVRQIQEDRAAAAALTARAVRVVEDTEPGLSAKSLRVSAPRNP
jgi:hypothetical protein